MKFFKKLSIILFVLLFAVSAWAVTYKQVDFLLAGYRTPATDVVLSGGKVYTYLAGTSTLSALKTDKDGSGTATNPIILDSSGKAEVFGAQIYKFVIHDSDDVLIETIEGIEYKTQADFVSDITYNKTTWDGVTTIAPSKNVVRDQFQVILEGFTAEGPIDSNGHQINQSIGADVASASALPILPDGNYYSVTGTTNIDTIDTTGEIGTIIILLHEGVLDLNYDATDLITLSGATMTTAAGDQSIWIEYASGDFRMINYSSGSSGVIPLSTVTVSAQATVDIETTFDSTYDYYELICTNVVPSNDNVALETLLKIGGSYLTTGYYYHTSRYLSNATTYSAFSAPNASEIALTDGMGNDTDESGEFTISFHNVHGTTKNKLIYWLGVFEFDGIVRGIRGSAGQLTNAAALTGIRLQMASGNISGTFTLVGYNK